MIFCITIYKHTYHACNMGVESACIIKHGRIHCSYSATIYPKQLVTQSHAIDRPKDHHPFQSHQSSPASCRDGGLILAECEILWLTGRANLCTNRSILAARNINQDQSVIDF